MEEEMMNVDFKRCLEEGKLVEVRAERDLVEKELREAEGDLASAEFSLSSGNFKWCAVQAYYSVFHAAKALVLVKGYREKSHACLYVALETLYVESGAMERRFLDAFWEAKTARESADYRMKYGAALSGKAVENAKLFVRKAREIIQK